MIHPVKKLSPAPVPVIDRDSDFRPPRPQRSHNRPPRPHRGRAHSLTGIQENLRIKIHQIALLCEVTTLSLCEEALNDLCKKYRSKLIKSIQDGF
jgi:hypothetical protein